MYTHNFQSTLVPGTKKGINGGGNRIHTRVPDVGDQRKTFDGYSFRQELGVFNHHLTSEPRHVSVCPSDLDGILVRAPLPAPRDTVWTGMFWPLSN